MHSPAAAQTAPLGARPARLSAAQDAARCDVTKRAAGSSSASQSAHTICFVRGTVRAAMTSCDRVTLGQREPPTLEQSDELELYNLLLIRHSVIALPIPGRPRLARVAAHDMGEGRHSRQGVAT